MERGVDRLPHLNFGSINKSCFEGGLWELKTPQPWGPGRVSDYRVNHSPRCRPPAARRQFVQHSESSPSPPTRRRRSGHLSGFASFRLSLRGPSRALPLLWYRPLLPCPSFSAQASQETPQTVKRMRVRLHALLLYCVHPEGRDFT